MVFPNNVDSTEATLLQDGDGLQMVLEPILLLGGGTPHPRLWRRLDEAAGEDQEGSDRVIPQVEPPFGPPFVGRRQRE
jgi:hypothetical protein